MLCENKRYDLIIEGEDTDKIHDLMEILDNATITLQGFKYPTININLLFMEHIQHE